MVPGRIYFMCFIISETLIGWHTDVTHDCCVMLPCCTEYIEGSSSTYFQAIFPYAGLDYGHSGGKQGLFAGEFYSWNF